MALNLGRVATASFVAWTVIAQSSSPALHLLQTGVAVRNHLQMDINTTDNANVRMDTNTTDNANGFPNPIWNLEESIASEALTEGIWENAGASTLQPYLNKVAHKGVKFFMYAPSEYEPRFRGGLSSCDRKGADYLFINRLLDHPRRVQNSSDADVFVVPCLFESYRRCTTTNHAEKPPSLAQFIRQTAEPSGHPMPASLLGENKGEKQGENPHPEDFEAIPWSQALDSDTQQCLNKVMSTDTYQKNWGRDHLWVVADWTMNFGRTSESETFKNMTIGRIEVVDEDGARTSNRPQAVEQSHCSFVVPYASDLAYVEDWDKRTSFEQWMARKRTVQFRFEDRQYVLFCQAEPCDGAFDATPLRRKSLELGQLFGDQGEIAMERVPVDQYISEVHNAKFCLVVRGDTPSSHGFYDALAADCIPILVSDKWTAVAGPFAQGQHGVLRKGLDTSEYTFQISEKRWMNDIRGVKRDIEELLADTARVRELYQRMQEHKKALLWSMPDNKVSDLALYSAYECMQS